MRTRSSRAVERRDVDDALARAVICSIIARALAAPAGDDRPVPSRGPDRDALEAALAHLHLPSIGGEGWFGRREGFDALFGHTARGVVCPYEIEYGSLHVFRQCQELADIQGYYAAFGLVRREDRAERADHLGVEFEFLGFLAQKEAYALEAGDGEQAGVARRAYRAFLRDHVSRFGFTVSAQLVRADPRGFYGRLGALCRDFLKAECERLEIEAGPEFLSVGETEPEDVPMACGGAEAGCVGCGDPEGERAAPQTGACSPYPDPPEGEEG